jgi:hypothetical protein
VNFAAYEGRPNNARTELDRAVFGLLKMRNYLELTWKSTTYATPTAPAFAKASTSAEAAARQDGAASPSLL